MPRKPSSPAKPPTRRILSTTRDKEWPDSTFIIHMLDVGATKYGHCFVVVAGDKSILIDAGHSSDFQGQNGYDSIPEQLQKIFGKSTGIEVDLFVITHVHSDHIGCAPELISSGTILPKMALVADPEYGFGHAGSTDAADNLTYLSSGQRGLVAALMEEPLGADATDAEIQQFIGDAANLESKYNDMLDSLKTNLGKNLIIYDGTNASPVEQMFASIGLQVPGPTQEHLLKCSQGIARDAEKKASDVASQLQEDSAGSMASMYRALASPPDVQTADWVPGPNAGGKNDTSIVLTFNYAGCRVLLTGDMQFEQPQVEGLEEDMAQLLDKVSSGVTYDFIQIPHHGSYNAAGANVFKTWNATKRYAMSGGLKDPDHPNPQTLTLLGQMLEQESALQWARTDHNGRVTVDLSGSGVQFSLSRGQLNDTEPNPKPTSSSSASRTRRPRPSGDAYSHPIASVDNEMVEVTALVPHKATTINIQITVSPGGLAPTGTAGRTTSRSPDVEVPLSVTAPKAPSSLTPIAKVGASGFQLGSGRPLPRLLVVTSRKTLAANIGQEEEATVYAAIQRQGWPLVDLPTGSSATAAASLVHAKLTQNVGGVLLLGGYDVVPPFKLDVLDPALRQAVQTPPRVIDNDNFIVWNDDIYGDSDGDTLPEFPVSRIPDGKSSQFVFTALQAKAPVTRARRFGFRNILRPFADQVYKTIPGNEPILQCTPSGPGNVSAAALDCSSVYFMLHGADWDGSKFWGNDPVSGSEPEAFNSNRIGPMKGAVVFSGACWGALVSRVTANDSTPNQPLPTRVPGNSIALSFLLNGALAYVGCTGVHYSPIANANCFGQPMHEAFWQEINSGSAPAVALFNAKKAYLSGMPHGQSSTAGRAIEAKLLREFTCLGLGW